MRIYFYPSPKVIARERKAAEKAAREQRCQVTTPDVQHKGKVAIDKKMMRPIAACAACRAVFRQS